MCLRGSVLRHRQRDLELNPVVSCASGAHLQTADNIVLIFSWAGSCEDEQQLCGAVSHRAGWRDDLLGYHFRSQAGMNATDLVGAITPWVILVRKIPQTPPHRALSF